MNKSYYYFSEAREVLGPVSEETLKELHKVGAIGDNPQICAKGTKNWERFDSVFPSAKKAASPAPSASNPQPAGAKAEGTSLPPQQPPPLAQPHKPGGRTVPLKPLLIGCGGAAFLGILLLVGLAAMFGGSGGSDAAGSPPPSYSESPGYQTRKHPCGRCGGSGQLIGQCKKCYGAGTIMSRGPNYDGIQPYTEPMQIPCPQCRGSGQMPVPCTRCRGTGHQ